MFKIEIKFLKYNYPTYWKVCRKHMIFHRYTILNNSFQRQHQAIKETVAQNPKVQSSNLNSKSQPLSSLCSSFSLICLRKRGEGILRCEAQEQSCCGSPCKQWIIPYQAHPHFSAQKSVLGCDISIWGYGALSETSETGCLTEQELRSHCHIALSCSPLPTGLVTLCKHWFLQLPQPLPTLNFL